VIQGDLTRPDTLDTCLEGIDAAFLVWTAPADAAAGALERIAKRAPRIVFLSSPHQTQHPFFRQPSARVASAVQVEIERLIETSGRQWTFLRPGMFAGNAVGWWAPQIRAGSDVVRWPHADAATAPIDERDIAAAAVRALLEDCHTGAEYVLTGPQSLSQREQLAAIGSAIGRPLRMEEIPPDDARRELLANMPSARVIDMLLEAWAAAIGQPALVTSAVFEITRTPAGTFGDWAADHAAAFRA
jgi:uncharacterized protein YbjT (DUF2867 family)